MTLLGKAHMRGPLAGFSQSALNWAGLFKVATRGVKLWKEFDDTVFKLPKEKWLAWLIERRDEVIGKLNKDFTKPWFGWKKDGGVAKELGDMTYEEVVLRMVRLMFVSHEKCWGG
jgi:fatty acid synthase subunit alpha